MAFMQREIHPLVLLERELNQFIDELFKEYSSLLMEKETELYYLSTDTDVTNSLGLVAVVDILDIVDIHRPTKEQLCKK